MAPGGRRKLPAFAKLILDLAAELNQGRIGSKDHWRQLDPTQDPEFKEPQLLTRLQVGVPAARTYLAFFVSTCWIEKGKVSPVVNDTEHGFQITVLSNAPYPLLAALACELMLPIARIPAIASCSECGRLYAPRRQVRQDRDNFCPDCSRSAAVRRAAQRWRARRRAVSGS